MNTETIDKLFLELSQFTRATTEKELAANEQTAYWCKRYNIERARAEAAEFERNALRAFQHESGRKMAECAARVAEFEVQVAQLRTASAVLLEAVRNWTPTDHNGSHGTALDEGLRIVGTVLADTAPEEAEER